MSVETEEEGLDSCREALSERGTPGRRRCEQRITGVAEIQALDEHLGHRRPVEAAEVITGADASDAEVGRGLESPNVIERTPQITGEMPRRLEDGGGVAHRTHHETGFDHLESSSIRWATVAVERHRHRGVESVRNRRPFGDAGSDATIIWPGQHDTCPECSEITLEKFCDSEGEDVF